MSIEYPKEVMEFGMSAGELEWGVRMFVASAVDRVHGPGREQYERPSDIPGRVYQAFELMTPREILRMAREEVQDLGVYAAMTDIRLARLEKALEVNDTIGDAR